MKRAEAEATIAAGSQSFAAAARLLPRGMRDDAVLLYAWCRYADDVVDGQVLGHPGGGAVDAPQARLAALRAETLAASQGEAPVSPPFAALRGVARRHDFPDAWPLDLIAGFAMDVEGRRYATLHDTLDYAYHVAGVVGLMMARVMGVRDEAALDRACDLGIAFQLTNIARDVRDDARLGRVYLPGDWLAEAGAEVTDGPPSDALYRVVLRLLDTADGFYASAEHGLAALPPRAAWSIAAALRIYQAIGARIRAAGPAAYATRISTSRGRKAQLVLRALGDVAASRRRVPAGARDLPWSRPRPAQAAKAGSAGSTAAMNASTGAPR